MTKTSRTCLLRNKYRIIKYRADKLPKNSKDLTKLKYTHKGQVI